MFPINSRGIEKIPFNWGRTTNGYGFQMSRFQSTIAQPTWYFTRTNSANDIFKLGSQESSIEIAIVVIWSCEMTGVNLENLY